MCRLQSVLIAFLLLCPGSLLAQGTGAKDESLEDLAKKMIAPTYTPEEIQPVLNAEKANNYKQVIQLADALIAKPTESIGEASYGYWIKSLAHMHRGRAREHLGGTFRDAFEDEKRAADLGNFEAIQNINKFMLGDLSGDSPIGDGYKTSAGDLGKYFRFAAELGDPFAEAMIGLGKVPADVKDDEHVYWFLLGVMRDFVMESDQKRKMFHDVLEKVGEEKVEGAIEKYSLVGGVLDKSPLGFPKRGLISTLFVDGDLRGSFEKLYGLSAKLPDKVPEAPTVAEQWEFYEKVNDDLGWASAYMAVPGDRKFDDPRIVSKPATEIMAALEPDDRIFVRCGSLAHVAIVFKIYKAKDKIYLADGAFQFWQPSHNACIKSFTLADHAEHRYLTVVSISEVRPILQAVITMRDSLPKETPPKSK